MAERSFKKEQEEEQEEEDTERCDDHGNDEDEEDDVDEDNEGSEEEDEKEDELGLEYGRKKVMIRVVSAGHRLSAMVPFMNGSSSGNNISGIGSLGCQADECSVDLRMGKTYHKRHKVCERHSRAAVVLVNGVRQRFCQQCSKFHEISEFDDNKKSCRVKLAGHNERRRKTHSKLIKAEDEQKPSECRMNGSLVKATRNSKCGETSDLRGSPNMKHSRIK